MRERRHYDAMIVKRRRRAHRNGKDDKWDLDSRAYKARNWRKYADSWVDFDNRMYARQPRKKGKKGYRKYPREP